MTAYVSTAENDTDEDMIMMTTQHGTGGEEEESAEATVIDSAPLLTDGSTGEAIPPWKYTEEAQVLEHEHMTTHEAILEEEEEDSKLPASDNHHRYLRGISDDEDDIGYAVADQEAEVVGIQEDVHPYHAASSS